MLSLEVLGRALAASRSILKSTGRPQQASAGLAGSYGALFIAFLVTWHPPLCGRLSSLPMKTLRCIKGLPYSTLDWVSNEIISGKKRGVGTKFTNSLKNVSFQVRSNRADHKLRRPLCKERRKQSLELSRCGEEVRRGRGNLDACLSQKHHRESLLRAFSNVQCQNDHFAHQGREVLMCCYWNASKMLLSQDGH